MSPLKSNQHFLQRLDWKRGVTNR